ncbi:hypothetical protein J2T57_001657 [Natronocella acetinitrilica]|uniref:Uncharacterized protein n=1 Tax=Natronocella acetinitrilica TaxID=414046 RepID=A0AAE3KAN1_9GAMM|nr:hypothetical protein [Natronocella acetinitrilica]MCP1674555.1 hypothetical protein [Natronocella acetinitrilica]
MRLDAATEEFVSSRALNGAQYSIHWNAKAATVLSHLIYSDHRIIEAVIREITCNAADAHVAAGRGDQPVTVELPTALSPAFVVRDQGVGLDHASALALFSGYFASLSEQSTAATGHFGLGAKSPYAYQDQFTIRTVKDAEACTFHAYKDAENRPCLETLSREAVDEPDGVCVSIPVDHDDIERFRRVAAAVFLSFRVRPMVSDPEVAEQIAQWDAAHASASQLAGAGWRIAPLARKIGGETLTPPASEQGNRVVLGDVSYPLDLEALAAVAGVSFTRLRLDPARVRDLTLVLDIGREAIALHPSRESIQYTEATCRLLVSRLRAMLDEIRAGVRDRLGPGASAWQIRCHLGGSLAYPSWLLEAFGVRWDRQIALGADAARALLDLARLYVADSGDDGKTTLVWPRRLSGRQPKLSDSLGVSYHPGVRLFVVDAGAAPRAAIGAYLREEARRTGVPTRGIVMRLSVGQDDPGFAAAVHQLRRALGKPEVIRTSTLSAPGAATERPADCLDQLSVVRDDDPGFDWRGSLRGDLAPVCGTLAPEALAAGAPALPLFECNRWHLAHLPGSAEALPGIEPAQCARIIAALFPDTPVVTVRPASRALVHDHPVLVPAARWLAERLASMGSSGAACRALQKRLYRRCRAEIINDALVPRLEALIPRQADGDALSAGALALLGDPEGVPAPLRALLAALPRLSAYYARYCGSARGYQYGYGSRAEGRVAQALSDALVAVLSLPAHARLRAQTLAPGERCAARLRTRLLGALDAFEAAYPLLAGNPGLLRWLERDPGAVREYLALKNTTPA